MIDQAVLGKIAPERFAPERDGGMPAWILAAQLSSESPTVQEAIDDIDAFLIQNANKLRELHRRVIERPAAIRELSDGDLMILLLPTHLHFMRRLRDRLQSLTAEAAAK